MRHADGRLLFSATDLSRHLSCAHLTSLRRTVALGEIEPPTPYDDPRAEILKQRGIEHERRLLERFAAEGRAVEIVTPPESPFPERDPGEAAARTREAMRRGVDIVYQGRLQDDDGRWSGYPDFLLRVDEASALGGWSYEVLDAKLARIAKGEALLQLLLYSDLLAQVQGTGPEWMHLALGGSDGPREASFRVVEYSAYYRAVRRRFEAQAAEPPDTYPEPVDHCALLLVHDGTVLRGAAPHVPGAGSADGDRTGPAGRPRPAFRTGGARRQHERLLLPLPGAGGDHTLSTLIRAHRICLPTFGRHVST